MFNLIKINKSLMNLLTLLTLLLILSQTIYCQVTDEHDPNNFLPSEKKRPSQFSEQGYCEMCIHFLDRAVQELNEKRSEIDVVDLLARMFDRQEIHDYFPEKFIIFADHFIGIFEEEVIESLTKRASREDAIYQACYEFSKACKGMETRQQIQEQQEKEQEYKLNEELESNNSNNNINENRVEEPKEELNTEL